MQKVHGSIDIEDPIAINEYTDQKHQDSKLNNYRDKYRSSENFRKKLNFENNELNESQSTRNIITHKSDFFKKHSTQKNLNLDQNQIESQSPQHSKRSEKHQNNMRNTEKLLASRIKNLNDKTNNMAKIRDAIDNFMINEKLVVMMLDFNNFKAKKGFFNHYQT